MDSSDKGKSMSPMRVSRMKKLRGIILGTWQVVAGVARQLRRVNIWLAQRLHISQRWSQRFFKIEVGVLLAGGATMIQLGEYAFAVVLWIVLSLIWISKILEWKTISGSSRRIALVKGLNIFLALAVVTTIITWTNIKRDENDWTALQKLWTHNPLRILTVVTNKEYSAGTVIEGIEWQPYYTELDIIFNNPTDASYEDVNILIRPDYPVAKIAQMSNLADVSFEDKMGLTARLTIEEAPTYPRDAPFGAATPFMIVANSVGYRVHCGRIPPVSSLRLVMALVNAPKASKSIPYRPGMILPPVEKTDFTSELSYGSEGSYWFALSGVRNYFGSRPNPQVLTVDGSYIADGKRQRIKQKVQTR